MALLRACVNALTSLECFLPAGDQNRCQQALCTDKQPSGNLLATRLVHCSSDAKSIFVVAMSFTFLMNDQACSDLLRSIAAVDRSKPHVDV